MDKSALAALLREFQMNPPALGTEIDAAEAELGVSLPGEYRNFILFADGGEGFIGPNSYAMLCRVGELCQFNREYEVREYASGLVLFGSNGGGEALGFDLRGALQPIVSVPFIGMDLREAIPLASTFDGFLEYLGGQ